MAYCLTSGTIATTSGMLGITLDSTAIPNSSTRLATKRLVPSQLPIELPSAPMTPVLSSAPTSTKIQMKNSSVSQSTSRRISRTESSLVVKAISSTNPEPITATAGGETGGSIDSPNMNRAIITASTAEQAASANGD